MPIPFIAGLLSSVAGLIAASKPKKLEGRATTPIDLDRRGNQGINGGDMSGKRRSGRADRIAQGASYYEVRLRVALGPKAGDDDDVARDTHYILAGRSIDSGIDGREQYRNYCQFLSACYWAFEQVARVTISEQCHGSQPQATSHS